MYVWFSIDPLAAPIPSPTIPAGSQDNFNVNFHICHLDVQSPPETNGDVLIQRRNAVMKIITSNHPELKVDEKTRVYLAVANLVRCLPHGYDDLDFAIHLSVAHHCLPPAERAAREQGIDAIFQLYFGPPPSRRADVKQWLESMRLQLLLLPNAMMEVWASNCCGLLLSQTLMSPNDPNCDSQARRQFLLMNDVVGRLEASAQDKRLLMGTLTAAYCLFPPARRPSFMDAVLDPKHHKALPIVERAETVLIAKIPNITPFQTVDSAVGAFVDAATAGIAPGDTRVEEIIEVWVDRERSKVSRMSSRAQDDTIKAMEAGVPMGERGAASLAVMAKLLKAERTRDASLALKRQTQSKAPTAKATPPAVGPTDMDPVHAWSVARLVRWIEGPVAERSSQGRLNRNTVIENERKATARAAKQLQAAGLPADAPAPPVTAEDVDLAMHDGLAATARFFHDDIQELAPLGKSLNATADLLDPCLQLQAQLQALSEHPAEFDEEKARLLLQEAEGCIGELRKGIKVVQASAEQARRFSARLNLALNAEALVQGKRHGGVIACPLQATDWPWVAQMFHRRWLPQATKLVIDGQTVPLQANQALALYVTGSSQSNHAFDVSVHLWQRRAGRTGPPSEGDQLHDAMNTTDWFDTYIPCAVLHVPQAG